MPFFFVGVSTGMVPFCCWDVGTRLVPFFFCHRHGAELDRLLGHLDRAGSVFSWAIGTGLGLLLGHRDEDRLGVALVRSAAREGDGRQPRRRPGRNPDGGGPAAAGWRDRTCAAPILGPVAEVRDPQAQPEAEDERQEAELRRPRRDWAAGVLGGTTSTRVTKVLSGAFSALCQSRSFSRISAWASCTTRSASAGDVLSPTM